MVTWWLVGTVDRDSRDSLTGMSIAKSEGALTNSSKHGSEGVAKSESSPVKIQAKTSYSKLAGGVNGTSSIHRMSSHESVDQNLSLPGSVDVEDKNEAS